MSVSEKWKYFSEPEKWKYFSEPEKWKYFSKPENDSSENNFSGSEKLRTTNGLFHFSFAFNFVLKKE